MPEVADSTRRFRLDDKVVVLTGASSGLGAQWTVTLAGAGAKLVVTARRASELAAIAEPVGALAIPGDLTSEDHPERLVADTLERHGRIDVLINNAGTAVSAPAVDTELADFRAMIETDLAAVFALALDGTIIYLASDASTYVTGRHLLVDGGWSVY